jgi:hypothetical protein
LHAVLALLDALNGRAVVEGKLSKTKCALGRIEAVGPMDKIRNIALDLILLAIVAGRIKAFEHSLGLYWHNPSRC